MAFAGIEETNDQFDRLPNEILHLIFNKLHDAHSLTRSMSVCKRFASIIPENNTVSLAVPRKISLKQQPCIDHPIATKSNCNRCGRQLGSTASKSVSKSLIGKIIATPIRFILRRIFTSKSTRLDDETDCTFYSPHQVLKNFKEIQSLRIEIPRGEIGLDGRDSLLRWRAEFGSELESCVLFGAKSLHKRSQNPNFDKKIDERRQQEGNRSDEEQFIGDDELKLRIVWAISCLISASARHSLLKKVVLEHLMLRRVAIGDGSNQGKVRMSREQIEELRRKNVNLEVESETERTPLPALKMKMWYAEELELKEGWVVEGATVLVIRPVEKEKEEKERDCDLVSRVWNGGDDEEENTVFGEAVREMMKKKKSCTLEMNSF